MVGTALKDSLSVVGRRDGGRSDRGRMTTAVPPFRRSARFIAFALSALSCSSPRAGTVKLPADQPAADKRDQSPVAINPEPPVEYPAALFEEGIEGKVLLRLHTDEEGNVDRDSISIAESSGYPALDSAALIAAPQLRFAPALHNGAPVAATFLQPVHFRHPQLGGTTP